jgi:hypothetical protein
MKWTAYIWNGDFFYAGDPAARLTGCSPRNIRITPGTQPGDRDIEEEPDVTADPDAGREVRLSLGE